VKAAQDEMIARKEVFEVDAEILEEALRRFPDNPQMAKALRDVQKYLGAIAEFDWDRGALATPPLPAKSPVSAKDLSAGSCSSILSPRIFVRAGCWQEKSQRKAIRSNH
jgi:hypothetical protein